MQTRPCNIQRHFVSAVKKLKFSPEKKKIFYLFLLKGTLTSTHNLCFGAKNKKNRYTPAYPSFTV